MPFGASCEGRALSLQDLHLQGSSTSKDDSDWSCPSTSLSWSDLTKHMTQLEWFRTKLPGYLLEQTFEQNEDWETKSGWERWNAHTKAWVFWNLCCHMLPWSVLWGQHETCLTSTLKAWQVYKIMNTFQQSVKPSLGQFSMLKHLLRLVYIADPQNTNATCNERKVSRVLSRSLKHDVSLTLCWNGSIVCPWDMFTFCLCSRCPARSM